MASTHSKFIVPFYLAAHLAAGIALSAAPRVGFASESADLIVRGANIYTVDPSVPRATALAVKGGRFLAVGSDADIQKYAGAGTRILDLKGQFVLPGFIDSHLHIQLGGRYAAGVMLRDARTLAEVKRRVAAYAKAHPENKWILGEAWSYGYPDMPHGGPTRQMLDAIVPDRPVFLGSGMAHAGWANTKALELAGITKDSPDPAGGKFIREPDGTPSGWLQENASDEFERHIPKETNAELREDIQAAMREAAKVGVTRLVSAGGDWDTLPILAEWERDGKLLVRFSISQWIMPRTFDEKVVQTLLDGRTRYHSDWVRTGAVKFIEDGVIESHTAYMSDGYADDRKNKGISFWDAQKQQAAVIELSKLGFQVYTHAIGDGAIKQTLDAYEAAERAGAPQDWRPRIEHYEAPYPADIDRLVRLKVIASMQPAMIYPKDQWIGMEGLWQKYAGAKLAKTAFPIRSVLAKGGVVSFGTDWPVIDLNPMIGLRDAVLRQSFDGEPTGGWVPAERISIEEAIKSYTYAAAYAAHREHDEGSITVGKLADFVALSDDLTKTQPARIHEVRVLTTVVGGKITYQAPQ